MKSYDWKSYVELIGIVAIVASLIFVGMQLRQDRKIAMAEIVSSYAANAATPRIHSSAYAEILAKGNRGEKLGDAELIILTDLIEIRENNVLLQNLAFRNLGQSSVTAEIMFTSFLYRNPAARFAWERHDQNIAATVDPLRTPESLDKTYKIGSGSFRNRIKDYLAKLDSFRDQSSGIRD